ncbi:MAG: family 43 glycosylhydrolase [Kiritimatiellia bacterium]
MKQLFACGLVLAGLVSAGGAAAPKLVSRDEFRIRDPFVLPEGDTYYLYESKPWSGGKGVAVRTSKDLERWTEKEMVLQLPPEVKNTAVWAPEVHKYAGAYWLFTTLTFDPVKPGDTDAPPYLKPIRPMLEKGFSGGALQPRGVWVFRSDRPKGPFVPVKLGSVTPQEWMCLDGTLWVEDGVPWMVFCHEWCQTGNGRMMAAPMSPDLASFTAAPVELFRAACLPGAGHVTDGPFLVKSDEAGLRMIWSNFLKGNGYCVLQCKSLSGKVAGPWTAQTPLFTRDGGHGMLFRRFDGQLTLSLHQPNSNNERMKLFPLRLTGEGLVRCDGKAPAGSGPR